MTHSAVETELELSRGFIREHLGPDVPDDSDLFESGLASSLFAVQIVMWIERTFEISVQSHEMNIENFQSIAAVAEFVRQRRF